MHDVTKSAMVNGIWQETPTISISDSGLAYGLAIFETMRVVEGRIPLLPLHLSRLSQSIEAMCIPAGAIDLLMSDLSAYVARQAFSEGMIRLTLTAGTADRGYQLDSARTATRIVQGYDLPAYSTTVQAVGLSKTKLALNPMLAGIKHSNRIEQVVARQELGTLSHVDDLLMLDANNQVVEAISSNLFVIENNAVVTPCLSNSGVKGVMRSHLLASVGAAQTSLSVESLQAAEELLLSNALGVRRVESLVLEGQVIQYRPTKLGDQLMDAVPW